MKIEDIVSDLADKIQESTSNRNKSLYASAIAKLGALEPENEGESEGKGDNPREVSQE